MNRMPLRSDSDDVRGNVAPRLLVVDDYPPNLVAIEAALDGLGEPLRSESSSQKALEFLLDGDYAVALVDVQMPHLSGLELASQLRQRGNDTPIIFLTAKEGDDRLKERGYQLGAVDFIVKPVEADVLCAKVRTFLKLHGQKCELARLTTLYDAERRAARQQLRTLTGVSAALAGCLTEGDVVQSFICQAHEAVVATSSFVFVRSNDRPDQLDVAAMRGVVPPMLERFRRVPLDAQLPLTTAVKRGAPVWISNREQLLQESPALAGSSVSQAVAALPVIVNGVTLGGVVFVFSEPRAWDIDEREFFVTLVAQFATALERAQLLATERRAHEELGRRSEAIRLMTDVGTLLSSSLDQEFMLSQLTKLLVPVMADWCAVDLLGDDGQLRRLSVHHADPTKLDQLREMEARYPEHVETEPGAFRVVRTGETEWTPEITELDLAHVARDADHLSRIRGLGLRSYIAVPLTARGCVFGALTLVYSETDRRYSADDVRYVEQLAQRAGLAVDNAILFREQVKAREALERRTEQALLVADVGTALARGSGTLTEALQRCVEAIVRHSDAAAALIWTANVRGGETLDLEACAGIVPFEGPQAHIEMGKYTIGLIAQSRTLFATNDFSREPWTHDPDWLRPEGMTAFAGYPLIAGERLKGVLGVFSRNPLNEDAVAALSSIADAVAIGIDRTRADHRARVERDTLEAVNEVGRALAVELDQSRLVQAVTDYSTRLAGATYGAFFYHAQDSNGEPHLLYATAGVSSETMAGFAMPRTTTQLFAATFEEQTTVRVADVLKDPRYGQSPPHFGIPDGHVNVASYLAVPVVSRSGAVIGGLFFGHPQPNVFTERHEELVQGVAAQAAIAMDNARLFTEAQRLIAELDESNKELDQFAYIASHDLKAPLRGISNLSQWLEEDLADVLTSSAREHLGLLRNRVERMEGLINGILDYSRAGRLRTKSEFIDVGKLLQESIEMLSVPAAARIEIAPDMPQLVTERVPLQQVFMNLLSNAVKHSRRTDPRVRVAAREDGEFIEFSVTDNGPGIAPEFHERVWGIFQTLEPRDVVEGTGIGLSVVKKIVGHKGGRVDIHSKEGAGATFLFTWPKSEKASHV
jgi:GAF domain-containing protein/ActR/RegA family two-component response regulator